MLPVILTLELLVVIVELTPVTYMFPSFTEIVEEPPVINTLPPAALDIVELFPVIYAVPALLDIVVVSPVI